MQKKRKIMWFGIILFFSICFLNKTEAHAEGNAIPITMNGTFYYDKAYEVLKLVNAERAKVGAAPLVMDQELLQAAAVRAGEIQINFSHTRTNGESCFTTSDKLHGENIALGSQTASGVMKQWMNSTGHRGNILSTNYNSIGISCFSQGGVPYWVQAFSYDTSIQTPKPANTTKTDTYQVLPEYLSLTENVVVPTLSNKKRTYKIVMHTLNYGYRGFVAELEPDSFDWTSSNPNIVQVTADGTLNYVAPGTAKITVKAKTNSSVSRTFSVNAQGNISGAKVTNVTPVKYTGKKTKQTPIVTLDGQTLIAGKDYKITYSNNINAGTASMKITGINNCTGSITVKYKIIKLVKPVITLKATSKTKVKITWKKVPKATGYEIYCKTSNGSFKKVKTISKGSILQCTNKVSKGRTYTYKVRAIYQNSGKTLKSSYSAVQKIKMKK